MHPDNNLALPGDPMIVVVPLALSNAIYAKIDEALEEWPELLDQRENIFHDLLAYFDKHGVIPEFKIEPNNERKQS